MAKLLRMMTAKEKAAVMAALPQELRNIVEEVYAVTEQCWNCDHFIKYGLDQGLCKLHNQEVPMDKRKESYECFTLGTLDPF